MTENQATPNRIESMKRLLQELAPHKKTLSFVAISGLLMAASQAQMAVQIKDLMDGLQNKSQVTILSAGWIVLGLAAVMAIARFIHFYLLRVTGEYVSQQLRAKLQRKFMRLSLTFHNNYASGSGGLLTKILNDVSYVQNGLSLFGDLFREPFSFIFLLGWLFILNWKLTLSMMILLPVLGIFLKNIARSINKYSHRGFADLDRVTSVVKESLDGVRIIQAFNLEKEMERRFAHQFRSYLENRKKTHARTEITSPATEFLATAMVLGILTYMSLQIAEGKATYGDFASYLGTLLMINKPLKVLQDAYVRVQDTLVAASRIFLVLDQNSEVPPGLKGTDFPKNWNKIIFDNVSFSYGQGDVLKNISFEVPRGQMVAFVGASGSGKSTVVNLFQRFFDPLRGSIRIDGTETRDMDLNSLRQNLALVTQDVFLFGDSVETNIWSGDFSKPKDNVVDCAKAANAHDFIMRLPEKYQTRMGERGNLFSGGEKQRVSIARALFKDAPILILDEATSALDSQSEMEVQKGLDQLLQGRTSLVIAHRLSTIVKAHHIFVMREGRIVEQGNHEQLISQRGDYWALAQLQNLEFSSPV